MPWEANERYKKAYKDAEAIVKGNGWEDREGLSNGEFAQMVLDELVDLGLGDEWDEAVKMGVIDYVHGRPMKWTA